MNAPAQDALSGARTAVGQGVVKELRAMKT